MDYTLFTGNNATGGGGGTITGAFTTSADGTGGAVHGASGSMRFENCALITNHANGGVAASAPWTTQAGRGAGGAIASISSQTHLTVVNCTLAENSANGGLGFDNALGGSAEGGAIYGDASLVNVTLAGNSAKVGAGVTSNYHPAPQNGGSSIAGDAALTNTILVCAADQTNVAGVMTDGGHNICSDSSAQFTSTSSHNNMDPLLGPLADNGGLTPTLSLLPGSPALDAGDDSACPPTDQRGVARPQGFACDIGAFELAPKVSLTSGQTGKVQLHCAFLAGTTNRITASTNLLSWILLGTRMSDANGAFDFEDTGSADFRWRFYQIQIESPR